MPTHIAEQERKARAKRYATRLYDFVDDFTSGADLQALVVTSPAPRAVETAHAFADVFGGTILEHEAFGDGQRSEDLRVILRCAEILTEKLAQSELVILITHHPLVMPIFGQVTTQTLGQSAAIYGPDYAYGIHAVDLVKRIHASFGTVE